MKTQKLKIEEVLIEIPDREDLYDHVVNDWPHYLFRREGRYHCGYCGKTFGKAMSKMLFENEVICPGCGENLVLKCLSRRTNWKNLITEFRIEVFQVHEGRIAFRQYEAIQCVNSESLLEEITINEIQRETVYKGQMYYCIQHKSSYTGKITWTWGWINENDRMRRPVKRFYLYPTSMHDELSTTEVKYSGVGKALDEQGAKDTLWHSRRYIANAANLPWIEYVNKMGYSNLYKDMLEGNIDLRYVRPEIIKKYKQFIKETNATGRQIMIKRACELAGLDDKYAQSMLSMYQNEYFRWLLKLCKITTMSIENTVVYLRKLNDGNNTFGCGMGAYKPNYAKLYEDYLTMMVKIKCRPNTDLLAFPKDIQKAHDEAVVKFNVIENKSKNDEYAKRVPNLMDLSFEKDGLALIIPKDVNEIIQEGKSLSHCVGSYVDKVVDGVTTILFIRKLDNTDVPFYTLEFKNNRVVQCHGNHNINPTPSVQSFIDEWLEWTKNTKKKVKQKKSVMQLNTVNA